jgi:hypothetical protein
MGTVAKDAVTGAGGRDEAREGKLAAEQPAMRKATAAARPSRRRERGDA